MTEPLTAAPDLPPHRATEWLEVRKAGLFVKPAGLYIDPSRAVDHAVISHGHADHARSGHRHVIATPETAAIMRSRYGQNCAGEFREVTYGEQIQIGGLTITLVPAGHVLGSAQIVLDYAGCRVVVSGDYKRRRDPTCTLFQVVPCDVFVTEATFGLPVFTHPDPDDEIARLLDSHARRGQDRCHLVGSYSLGKAQRIIALLREAGHDAPIYLHGAMIKLCDLYHSLGVDLGELVPVADIPNKAELKGRIIIAPPSALNDKWASKLPSPVTSMASGWMRVRQRGRNRGVEVPMIISDHADWHELLQTIEDTAAEEVWVTHGREDALIHACIKRGITARALRLVGRDDEQD
ncbi:MAG: ligase-associated DNA damage response exonuclease [Alphaproteobacteria bacterium]